MLITAVSAWKKRGTHDRRLEFALVPQRSRPFHLHVLQTDIKRDEIKASRLMSNLYLSVILAIDVASPHTARNT